MRTAILVLLALTLSGCASRFHLQTHVDGTYDVEYMRTGFNLEMKGLKAQKGDVKVELEGTNAQFNGWEAIGKLGDAVKTLVEKAP